MNQKILDKLELIYKDFLKIGDQLSGLDIKKQLNQYNDLRREESKMEPIVNEYKKYSAILQETSELKEALNHETDQSMTNFLKHEIKNNELKLAEIEEKIKVLLIPQNPNDDKNVIVEIRGAVGGDEANIFAGDLYRMYIKYCETQRWKVETIEAKEATNGGFTQISFIIKGKHVFSKMKFEAGGHRVQRVPKTESKGRVHTSIATVAVLPEVNDVEVHINPVDLKIDTYRSSGAGGQHVNTTDSAIRITHLPTGIVVTSQDGRSQHDNKDKAMQVLRAKVYEKELEKQTLDIENKRKSAVGSGDRSEKIRTYNYAQNRVTDHRIGLTLQKLDRIMEGSIDEIIIALITEEQRKNLENLENNIATSK